MVSVFIFSVWLESFISFTDVHNFCDFVYMSRVMCIFFCQNGISISFRPRAVGTVNGAGVVAGNWVEKGSSDLS